MTSFEFSQKTCKVGTIVIPIVPEGDHGTEVFPNLVTDQGH